MTNSPSPSSSPTTTQDPDAHFPPLTASQSLTDKDGRPRQSRIQFSSNTPLPRPTRTATTSSIRAKSPPLRPKFEKGVSFDTFEKRSDPSTPNTSYTIRRKHIDFRRRKSTRTFLCGIDDNDYSTYALEWLLDELVDDHDEIVCLRVIDKDAPLADASSMKRRSYREEAERVIKDVEGRNHDNKVLNIILEFAVGKVEKTIMRMIKLYEPSLLIVGTKGRSNLAGIQGLLPGSVSKYCLQNSPIPVIVVRPNSQRARGKRKRQADKTRRQYRDLLDVGSEETLQAITPETNEAAAVAEAIGIPLNQAPRSESRSRLSQVHSASDDSTLQVESPVEEEPRRNGSTMSNGVEAPETIHEHVEAHHTSS